MLLFYFELKNNFLSHPESNHVNYLHESSKYTQDSNDLGGNGADFFSTESRMVEQIRARDYSRIVVMAMETDRSSPQVLGDVRQTRRQSRNDRRTMQATAFPRRDDQNHSRILRQ